MNELQKLTAAIAFAAEKHKNQKRKGAKAEPYINHPLQVLDILTNVGNVEDFEVLMAAVLHDTVEDTGTKKEEIAQIFGERACKIVMEVTDDKSLEKAVRKQLQIEHAPHLSVEAKLVKLADKISNVHDVMQNPPSDWSIERRREYIEWSEKVVEGLRGTNQNLENHFDELVKKSVQVKGEN